jgi:hypothetical protein
MKFPINFVVNVVIHNLTLVSHMLIKSLALTFDTRTQDNVPTHPVFTYLTIPLHLSPPSLLCSPSTFVSFIPSGPALYPSITQRHVELTKHTASTSTHSPTPLRLLDQPLPQKVLIPHLLRPRQPSIKLCLLPRKRQQRRHTANAVFYREILNQRAIHEHLHEAQSAFALSDLLLFNQLSDEGLDGLAGLTPGCGPEGYQGAIVGGIEEREVVEVVGLADGVEDAVCVRARGGVQEGEGAFVGAWEGIEAEGGEEGRSYHFGEFGGWVGMWRWDGGGYGFAGSGDA